MAQSVGCLPSAQVMILGSWDQALSRAPCSAGSLLLPLSPTRVLSSYLKWINKIYLFIWESNSGAGAGGGTQGDMIYKQTPHWDGSLTWEPDSGLDPRTLRSWPKLKSDTQLTEPLMHPMCVFFLSETSVILVYCEDKESNYRVKQNFWTCPTFALEKESLHAAKK